MNKKVKLCSIIIILITVDQVIKMQIENNLYNKTFQIIKNFLNFTYVQNTGGAYGIGTNYTAIIIIFNILIISVLLFILFYPKNKLIPIASICLSIAIAGGTSNLIDRVFRGYVIDYIDVTPIVSFPVFNVADICITLGGILLIFVIILDNRNK